METHGKKKSKKSEMIRTGSVSKRKAGMSASASPKEIRRQRDARQPMKTGAVFA